MPPLLKTCQTCHRAKIRCDRTQDSGACDRCLRLDKTCVFAPARRAVVPAPSSRARVAPLRRAGTSESSRSLSPAFTTTTDQQHQNEASTLDPFQGGLLDLDHGERLLASFHLKMVPHFPFVVVPDSIPLAQLRQARPALCLAILAVAAFEDPRLQRRLGNRFNQLVGLRLTKGRFATLDMLQGLLVSLAWAHYQPRPRRYTQHLHLATSIVSELRLDKPKNNMLWSVGDKYSEPNHDQWNSEELRALLGTYYLASSSSTLLQKSGYLRCTEFILDSCETLGERGETRTDRFLRHLIRLQQLSEEIDDVLTENSSREPRNHGFAARVLAVRNKLEVLKTDLTFPLSDCPTALLQSQTLETLLNQSPPQGTAFSPAGIQISRAEDHGPVIKYLSENISCVKSLIGMIFVLAPGEEFTLTNFSWIMLYRGLSLAVRLDMAATSEPIAHLTEHLHRQLDLRHTLRQIVLRLESAISPAEDDTGDRDAFYHLCHRARVVEKWYLAKYPPSPVSHPGDSPETSFGAAVSAGTDTDMTLQNLPQLMFSEAVGSDIFFGNDFFGDFSTTGLDITADDGFGMYPDQLGTFGD